MIRNTQVTVVGGGIGGLTAALLLARAGAGVTLLERAPEPREAGAGLLLQPNGLAVLDGLSLAADLERHGHPLTRAVVRTSTGLPIVDATVAGFGTGLDHVLAVRRGRLLAGLLRAVRAVPAIETRFGCEVLAAHADGTIEYDGHRVRADLVVGADGTHSIIRTAGDFGAVARDTGTTYVRCLVDGGDLGLEGEYWTALGLFGGAPIGDGSTYFYAAAHAAPIAEALARRDLTAFRHHWTRALPLSAAVLDRVAGFDDLLVNDVTRIDCARWADGRLVLLGDAAHAMAPTLGQGANSAIVDAAVLSIEMAAGRPLAEALRRYADRRRPRVRKVQDTADRLARLSAVTGPVPRAVRDRGLRLLDRLGPLAARQARIAQQEDPRTLRAAVAALSQTRIAAAGLTTGKKPRT
ncbi:FAD-dependent oxidoreductase [Nonomuraea basaltis]|uniref:FAD-dependent oxidoreductase n=1 Tax=Nonomuraea basaltis TaxID=2495887 RepID=UPI00110C5CA6|nr:NAD(P)/FAD-dependent oxidoreductase [Nonomuraea basaltis]TMR91425.1 FAD-dependent monooxygenase [Nonomuraea basaltis]